MTDPLFVVEGLQHMGGLTYWIIFGLSLLANIFIPVPEEVFLLTLGYVTGLPDSTLLPWLTIAIVLPGLLISDIFLYYLSKTGNRYVKLLEKRVQTFQFARDKSIISKNIVAIVFISRFIIQFRFIGPVLAGSVHMPIKKFILWDFVALAIYVPAVIWAGNFFSARIGKVIQGIAVAKNYVLAIVGFFFLFWLLIKARNMFFSRYMIGLKEKDGYVETFIPGIHKKVTTDLSEILEESSHTEQ